MSNLKLHKTQAMDNIFIEEKLLPWLNFNPGLELTGFRTTRPRATKEIMRGLSNIHERIRVVLGHDFLRTTRTTRTTRTGCETMAHESYSW